MQRSRRFARLMQPRIFRLSPLVRLQQILTSKMVSPLGRVAAPSGLRPCFALIASDATSRSAPPTLRPSGYVRFPASIPDPALLEIFHNVYTYTGVCIPEREQSYLKSDKTWIKVQFPILSGRHEPHHRWAGAILLIDLINSHVSRRNLLPWKYGEEAA